MALTRSNIPCDETPKAPFIPPKDPSYGGVPDGGTTGQALVKVSDEDGDVTWATIGSGGTPIIIDKTLSTTSTNAVENQAIGNAVADLGNQVALKADDAEVSAELATLSAAIALKADTADLDDYVEKEAGKGLSSNDYTNADKAIVAGVQTALDAKQDALTAGDNITITKNTQTGETVISSTGGSEGFVARYGVTTAQDIIAYLESGTPMPMFIERNGVYYTVTTAQKVNDNSVIVRSFATLSGHYYMFQYTVTGSSWSASNTGFQELLTAGSNITIVKNAQGETVISATGDVSVDWSDIENKPADLVQDADYVHTDNNYTDADKTIVGGVTAALDGKVDKETGKGLSTNDYTTAEKDKLAGLENYDDTALTGRVTGLESDVSDLEADVADLETIVTAYEDRIAALEAKLAKYEDVRLSLEDAAGSTTVYDLMGKKAYTNMFELPQGVYDANGEKIGALTGVTFDDPSADTAHYIHGDGTGEGEDISDVFVDRILSDYPNAKGIVLANAGMLNEKCIQNATSGALEWFCAYSRGWSGFPTMRYVTDLIDGGVTDAIGTLYLQDNTGAPWGTTATINTTGEPAPWA